MNGTYMINLYQFVLHLNNHVESTSFPILIKTLPSKNTAPYMPHCLHHTKLTQPAHYTTDGTSELVSYLLMQCSIIFHILYELTKGFS